MRRPLPVLPRGPRRPAAARPPRTQLLACPRVAPDWELAAVRALIKPQTKGAILHRPALQSWPVDGAAIVDDVRGAVRDRLGYDPRPHLPAAGDYFLVIEVSEPDRDAARAFALLLSRRMPGLWFVLANLFVRDGRFFRRERGWKLNVVPANNVHLTRQTWAALRGLL